MKRYQEAIIAVVTCAAGAVVPFVIIASRPAEVRTDATLMRPEVTFDRSGNGLKVRGAIRVLRPANSGRDHAVTIRLVVSQPGEGGQVVHEEDLGKIDYRRDHGPDVVPVRADVNLDVTGLDVKVSAAEGGHEFASVVDHGAEMPRPE